MKTDQEKQLNDITAIRDMMERASKFLSLSGLSGISAGIVASLGGIFSYWYIYVFVPENNMVVTEGFAHSDFRAVVLMLFVVLILVFLAAAFCAVFFTLRKSKGVKAIVLDVNAKRTILSIAIPLAVGAAIILSLLVHNQFDQIVAIMLLLYGVGLINAGYFTFRDISSLGYSEIAVGILALLAPKFSIELWTLGFGVLHILYGAIMYFKYDRKEQ